MGKCDCSEKYTGIFCQDFTCPKHADGTECGESSGFGSCDRGSGFCICSDAGAALDPKTACASKLCPKSNHEFDCSGSGTCVDGVCECEAGFQGDGCEDATPPWGAIIGGIIVLSAASACALSERSASFASAPSLAFRRAERV
eukprot:TRINITY_DN3535_c0_g1_i2.p2 TRINITY_DN3535_c0_g1~~TRINITY_DN3535_c0_g1_i2.p2  ORF type:complete len:143 (-),score=26.69 TRINITY_DN3535_c0_g1_i2:67-495(-)